MLSISVFCLRPSSIWVVVGVAFTANMVQPKPAAQGAFYFQKIFGDGDFLAAGQLIIPPGSTKPTKGTKDNTFVRSPSIHLVRHMSSHPIRSSMSSKARFSSACTRRILCCLLEACSWFLEVRATRRDSCDDVIPNWWLFPIYRQHILHPEHLRARRQTLLCSSAQDARGGVQGGRG